MEHTHNVVDKDTRFIIDPISRAIRTSSKKKSLVQFDHLSERFTFELSRFGVDNHDMSLCDRVEVHYINIDKKDKTKFNSDCDILNDLRVAEEDPDKVICSWLISANATQYAGLLSLLVRYLCTNGEEITYSWNTALYKEISVLEGMDNTETIIEEYSDVLNAWKEEVLAGIELSGKIKTINGVEPDEDGNIELNFEGTVKYSEPQELTEEEKNQARENIGFTEKIIEVLEGLGVIATLKDKDGKYILDGGGAILLLPKDKAETKAIILESLLELDIIPVIYDSDGAILTDGNGDLLLSK